MSYLHFKPYHLHRFSEVGRLYWSHTLGSMGMSMVSLFIPIYLYKLGYNLTEIIGFNLMLSVCFLATTYLAARSLHRFGTHRLMTFANFVRVIYFSLFIALPGWPWLFWIIPAVMAFAGPLYWLAFHLDFSESRTQGESNKQIGRLFAFAALAHGLAPAIGGIVATSYSINVMYGVGIGLSLAAGGTLLAGGSGIHPPKLSLKNLPLKSLLNGWFANFSYALYFLGEGFIWPLLIFLTFPNYSYAGVGVLSSTVVIASIIVPLYVGRREASKGTKHYLKEGTSIAVATNALRLLTQAPGAIFGFNFIAGIGHSLIDPPYLDRYYKRADSSNRLAVVYTIETANTVGHVLAFSVLLVLSLFLVDKIVLAIGLLLVTPAILGIKRM